MNSITIFGINFNINPVAFTIPLFGGWSVYWYGICIACGVFLALFYGMKNGKRFGIDPDDIFDSFVIVLPCSILSARAYYIIFDSTNSSSFKEFFDFSGKKGFQGLAIYGGVIGAVITIFIMQRIKKFSVLAALDITTVGFLIGQGIGRWGNFFNQEAYGTFTNSSWFGMTGGRIAAETGSNALVHPCFLYESIWCIAGFFLLNHFSKKRLFKGQIALMYGIWYGFERTFLELIRTDSLMLGPIRISSLLSAVLCVSCTIALVKLVPKYKNTEKYVPQFEQAEEMNYEAAEDKNEQDLQNDTAASKTSDEAGNLNEHN